MGLGYFSELLIRKGNKKYFFRVSSFIRMVFHSKLFVSLFDSGDISI